MTNLERYQNMTAEEFAKERVWHQPDYDFYYNDTGNSYGSSDEDYQKALNDEVNWLNSERE